MKKILLIIIALYQIFISPILLQLLGPQCRYELTCSEYAKKSIEKDGALKGLALAAKRLLSCSPFGQPFMKLEIPYEYS